MAKRAGRCSSRSPTTQTGTCPLASSQILASLKALWTGGTLPPFTLYGVGRRPGVVTIFADAPWAPEPPWKHGAGYVGFLVILLDGTFVFASERVPQDLLAALQPSSNPITTLETMALTGLYEFLLPRAFAGLDVNHFADNTGANGATIRGYTGNPDMARMIARHHLRTARIGTRVWVEWVKSQSNIAYLPSRPYEPGALRPILDMGATRVPFCFPTFRAWGEW